MFYHFLFLFYASESSSYRTTFYTDTVGSSAAETRDYEITSQVQQSGEHSGPLPSSCSSHPVWAGRPKPAIPPKPAFLKPKFDKQQ